MRRLTALPLLLAPALLVAGYTYYNSERTR